MKITQNVREFPTKEDVSEEKVLAMEMAEKAKEFVRKGSKIYQGNLPNGAQDSH